MSTKRLKILGLSLLVFAGIALYFFLDPAQYPFPECPFHTLTGYYCPGCGSQRAIHALLNINLVQAAQYNILLVASLPILLYYVFIKLFRKNTYPKLFYSNTFLWIVFVILIVFWLLRNLPFYPFTLLAPS